MSRTHPRAYRVLHCKTRDLYLTPGTVIYPHLRVAGAVYYNGGANNNGDIRGNGLTFKNEQSVTVGGQIYKIVREYEMPVLKISSVS